MTTTALRRTLLLALLLALAIPAAASAATLARKATARWSTPPLASAKNHVGVQGSDDDSTITFYTSGGDNDERAGRLHARPTSTAARS